MPKAKDKSQKSLNLKARAVGGEACVMSLSHSQHNLQPDLERAISKLGLAQIRRPSQHDDEALPLDDLTTAYVRHKLDLAEPGEARLEGLPDLVAQARERSASTRRYLARSSQQVDENLVRLHTFTQAPRGWFMDLCCRHKGIRLRLQPTFPNDGPSAEVRAAAGETLYLQLCLDEWHVPPRLVVMEIRATDGDGTRGVQSVTEVRATGGDRTPYGVQSVTETRTRDGDEIGAKDIVRDKDRDRDELGDLDRDQTGAKNGDRDRDMVDIRTRGRYIRAKERYRHSDKSRAKSKDRLRIRTRIRTESRDKISAKERDDTRGRDTYKDSDKIRTNNRDRDTDVIRSKDGDVTQDIQPVTSPLLTSETAADDVQNKARDGLKDTTPTWKEKEDRKASEGPNERVDMMAALEGPKDRIDMNVLVGANERADMMVMEGTTARLDMRVLRASAEALVPESSETRVLVRGHYPRKDHCGEEALHFDLFVFRETPRQSGSGEDGEPSDAAVLCGAYVRDMRTTDKRLRWKFRNDPVTVKCRGHDTGLN